MLALVYFLLLPFLFAFYLANKRRIEAVRGTSERYHFASLCRLLQWPSMAFPLSGALYHVSDGSFYLLPLDFITFYFVLVVVRTFSKDDDEDFWGKFKKKMKRVTKNLRATASKLAPKLTPAPQPA